MASVRLVPAMLLEAIPSFSYTQAKSVSVSVITCYHLGIGNLGYHLSCPAGLAETNLNYGYELFV